MHATLDNIHSLMKVGSGGAVIVNDVEKKKHILTFMKFRPIAAEDITP